MKTYTVTITTRYKMDLDNLEDCRREISEGYELATLPAFIPENSIEFLESDITYEEQD
tara:strand:- start:597 stop:770 length:174 start_codon:yes stop_codon:yes gene_type:complete